MDWVSWVDFGRDNQPMKAMPVKVADHQYATCDAAEATHLKMLFPGPLKHVVLPITRGKDKGMPQWQWNGDCESPTIKPSVRQRCGDILCHSFVTDGQVQFLGDCSHEHAGKTLDLLDIKFMGG